jgi:di/tricarboxylate transporter
MTKMATSIGGGDFGIIFAVFLVTLALSLILTNNAAAALTTPIILPVAFNTGIDVKICMITIMLAASDYMTPFGYQTNMMVYSAGNYRFLDFVKFGGIVQLVTGFAAVLVLTFSESWGIFWAASFPLIISYVIYYEAGDYIRERLRRRREGKRGAAPPLAHTDSRARPLL